MRVAWLGPAPREDHGVPAVATLLLRALADEGVGLDCFTVAPRDQIPELLTAQPGLRWVLQETRWHTDRWYSRRPTSAYLTLRATRAVNELRLGEAIVKRHKAQPYDVIYQFSAPEGLALGRHLRELPPLVLHPQVHAAGELRWHRREDALASRRESRSRREAVRVMLAARAHAQQRALRRAARIVCPSERFARLIAHDYGASGAAMRVVPNPVDLDRYSPPSAQRAAGEPIRLVFVGMLSVRKGVEMLVDLSQRLADLAGAVSIEIAGEPRDWSDYSGLLQDLQPEIARPLGWLEPEPLLALYRSADALLAPSHYEPFGLAVAEALACGVPVVASDAVGAAEFARGPACWTFPAGDLDAFETTTRALVADIRQGRDELSSAARNAAAHFCQQAVGRQLVAALAEAAGP